MKKGGEMVRKSDEERTREANIILAEITTAVTAVVAKAVFKEMDPQINAVFTGLFLFPIASQLIKAVRSENKQEFYGHLLAPIMYLVVANFFINSNFTDAMNGVSHLFDSIKQGTVQQATPQIATPEVLQKVVEQSQDLPARVFDILKGADALRNAINKSLSDRELAIIWANLGSSIISFIEKHPIELIALVSALPVVAASRKYWNKFRDTFDVSLEIRRKGDEQPHAPQTIVPIETLPGIARLQREFGGDD